MFLRAGLVSMLLLLASRLLGLLRESALAASLGAGALADIALVAFTLPDWVSGVVAAGALSYVLLPQWAALSPSDVARSQRRLAQVLLGLGLILAVAMALGLVPLRAALLPGAPEPLVGRALLWTALAVPAALLAALWGTRLQHGRDFTGLYGANLVVNATLIAALVLIAVQQDSMRATSQIGMSVALAAGLRLAWLRWRLARVSAGPGGGRSAPGTDAPATASGVTARAPGVGLWLAAALAAGLPLALPFVVRSLASAQGEGALAVFGYAWKLIELPQTLAIQVVAVLALPAIAQAAAQAGARTAPTPSGVVGPDAGAQAAAAAARPALALAWALACAAAAGLVVGAPAIAGLLFGWGRMTPGAVEAVAHLAATGAWSLPPLALMAVGAAVLAAQRRLHVLAGAAALALAGLVLAAPVQAPTSAQWMQALNLAHAGVAAVVLVAVFRAGHGSALRAGAPAGAARALRGAMGRASGGALLRAGLGAGVPLLLWAAGVALWGAAPPGATGLAVAVLAAASVGACAVAVSPDLRQALRR